MGNLRRPGGLFLVGLATLALTSCSLFSEKAERRVRVELSKTQSVQGRERAREVLPQKVEPKSKRVSFLTQDQKLSALVESEVSKLSLEERVGQLLVVGFSGKALNKSSLETLQKIRPGAVILF